MFNIGPVELMVVLVLALIIFGPAKLPELMASAGHAIREFQRASRELTEVFQETQQEFQSALDLDAQAQAQAQAEDAVVDDGRAEVEPWTSTVESAPVTQSPEEFETAAAMLDPVEAYEPSSEPATASADVIAEAPAEGVVASAPKPRRPRRKPAPSGDDAVPATQSFVEAPVASFDLTAPPPTEPAPPRRGGRRRKSAEVPEPVAATVEPAAPSAEPGPIFAPMPSADQPAHEPGTNGTSSVATRPRGRGTSVGAPSSDEA